MKKGQFSYQLGRSQSHASLNRHRRNTDDFKNQSLTKQPHTRPNVKFFAINHEANPKKKNINQRISEKPDQQLRKQNKLLQYQLKKKLNESSIMCKFFRTKNTSQLSHTDIYLEMSRMQDQIENCAKQKLQSQEKLQECTKQLQNLLQQKQNQQMAHLKVIEDVNDKIQMLKQKITASSNDLQRQKKRHEQTRLLLGEIRKKYQQINIQKQALKLKIQSHQKQLTDLQTDLSKKNKKNSENWQHQLKKYKQKLENKEDQLQKYKVREKQSQMVMEQMKQYYQQLRIKQEKQISCEKQKFKSKCVQIDCLQAKIEQLKSQKQQMSAIIHQETQKYLNLQNKIQKLQHSEHTQLQSIEHYCSQIRSLQSQHKNKNKQLGIASQKIMNLQSKIKILIYQRDEKQSIIKTQLKAITDLQTKLQTNEQNVYVLEKRNTASMQRIKQLEKIQQMYQQNKVSQYKSSKNQIHNYMALGRVMELVHQLKSLMNIDTTHSHDHNKLQSQNISDYISVLADLLDSFIKGQYQPAIQQVKNLREQIFGLQNDMKSLFNAYNNYIQDQQLLGYNSELIEALCSTDQINKKTKNQYIQLILQKLISMTAIKSYASDQTSNNVIMKKYQSNNQCRTRQCSNSRYRNRDSLQNTLKSKYQQQQSNIYYKKINASNSQHRRNVEDNRDKDSIRRLIKNKLETQPSQPKYYGDVNTLKNTRNYIRKLYTNAQDDKQNRNRENINEEYNSRNMDKYQSSIIQEKQKYRKLNKKKQLKFNRDGERDMEDIEKKYYR